MSETPGPRARRPKRLLSGLLTCGTCGGAMTLQGNAYACSAHRERGTCTNAKFIGAAIVEQRVVEGVKRHLLSPERIAQAVRDFHDSAKASRLSARATRAELEKQLSEAERRAARLVQMVEDGAPYSSVKDRLLDLEAAKARLSRDLAGVDAEPVLTLHPKAADHYRALVEGLSSALEGDDAEAAREAFRGLLTKVVFLPGEARGKFELEVHGELAGMLQPQNDKTPGRAVRREPGVMVGAGTGSLHNHSWSASVFAA